jgi:hypothetical protein
MSDPIEKEYLESIVNYYKTKTIQLEYDFVSYKIRSEQQVRELNKVIQDILARQEKDRLDRISNSNKVEKLKSLKKKIEKDQRSKK